MGDKESINQVDGQQYKSLPTEPPPSYNEVIHNQPSAPSLNAAGAIGSGDDIMPKPSAPTLEPDSYNGGLFANAGQQLMVTNAPYSTTTYEIPANNVIKDEGTPYVGRRRHLPEDDDGCCCCCCSDDGCEGCLACMTVFNCIVQCCSLILQIATACSKD